MLRNIVRIVTVLIISILIISCDYNFEGTNYFQVINTSQYTIDYVILNNEQICTNLLPGTKSNMFSFDTNENMIEVSFVNTGNFMGLGVGERYTTGGNLTYSGNRQNERYLVLYDTNIAICPDCYY